MHIDVRGWDFNRTHRSLHCHVLQSQSNVGAIFSNKFLVSPFPASPQLVQKKLVVRGCLHRACKRTPLPKFHVTQTLADHHTLTVLLAWNVMKSHSEYILHLWTYIKISSVLFSPGVLADVLWTYDSDCVCLVTIGLDMTPHLPVNSQSPHTLHLLQSLLLFSASWPPATSLSWHSAIWPPVTVRPPALTQKGCDCGNQTGGQRGFAVGL